jgi:hypothetical protein
MWYSHTRPWKVQPVSSDWKFWIWKNILMQQFFQYLIEEPIIKVVKIIIIFSQVFLIWHSLSRPHTIILSLFISFCVLFFVSFLICFFRFVVQNYAKFMLKQKIREEVIHCFCIFNFYLLIILQLRYLDTIELKEYFLPLSFRHVLTSFVSFLTKAIITKRNFIKR